VDLRDKAKEMIEGMGANRLFWFGVEQKLTNLGGIYES
jgi:hypothetical protein